MPRSFREKEQGDLGTQKAGWVRAWRAREEARRADCGSAGEGGGRRASSAARGRPPALGTCLLQGGPRRAGAELPRVARNAAFGSSPVHIPAAQECEQGVHCAP